MINIINIYLKLNIMLAFKKNYLYELPDDIQAIIYKKVYQYLLKNISDKRESIDNFNRLVEYINDKNNIDNNNRATWSILLCSRRDIGDPYYKYFAYYADYKTDFLQLNKTKMIRYNSAYSSIKYIDFRVPRILPSTNYNYIKNILEQYTHIFISLRHYNRNKYNDTDEEYRNIKEIKLLNDIIRVEYNDKYIFKCYIDIYNNILESYNFILYMLNILFNNNIFPEYNLDYMNDLRDIRDWFEYNLYFSGFKINEDGDTIKPTFYS
jgi:hypothetical protein